MSIERITADADLIRTALQQKYLDDAGEPVIRIDSEGVTDLFVHEEDGFETPSGGIDQPDERVDIRPERFVGGDLDLPDPDEELSSEELDTLTEYLGSELEAALAEDVDINADREGNEERVPVEYVSNDP